MKSYESPKMKIKFLKMTDILGASEGGAPEVSVVVDVAGEWN